MSFTGILGRIFRTPPEEEKEQREERHKDEAEDKVDDDDDDEEEPVGPETQMPAPEELNDTSPTIELPPPPPKRRSFAANRSRSLSKVFNQLPTFLPNRKEMEIDAMEYFCHVSLLENDPQKLWYYKKQLHQLVATHQVRKYGRFYTRLRLTACCSDIGCMRIGESKEDEEESKEEIDEDSELDDDDGVPFSVDISKEEWTEIKERFIQLKSLLLRQDANAYVPTMLEGYDNEEEEGRPIPEQNGKLDLVLEKHEMFHESYREVLLLLQIQEILSKFRESLQNLIERDYIKATEKAVDEYEVSLLALFQGKEGYVDPQQETDDTKVIPTELTRFLLPDLYRDITNLVPNLLKHINELVLNEHNVYSHVKLQQKMRALLTKWSESILEIPELIRLGYGGVTAPVIQEADDDYSAIGDDDHEPLPANARPLDKRESVTAEEREMIEHLAKQTTTTGRARKPARRVEQQRVAKKSPRKKPPPETVPEDQPLLTQPVQEDEDFAAADKSSEEEDVGDQKPKAKPKRTIEEDKDSDSDSETQDPDEVQYTGTRQSKEKKKNKADFLSSDEESFGTAQEPKFEIINVDDDETKENATPKRKHVAWYDSDSDVEILRSAYGESVKKRRLSSDPRPPRKGRKDPFTEEEADAIREGVEIFGKGHWKDIKENDPRLDNRTPGQISDKYRTMLRRGEI